MNRREFLSTATASVLAPAAVAAAQERPAPPPAGRFRLRYAPHFGMFKHHAGEDPVDQLQFAADQGFTAWEDNEMTRRPVAEQERIAAALERLGMQMGVFVANFGTAFGKKSFTTGDPEMLAAFLADLQSAVEVAKRVNARWMTIVLGDLEPRLDFAYQTANAVEMLRRGAEIFEPHGLVMVMEPLNPRDHPGMFLTTIGQAYQLCRAVRSPAVKILDDLYHQQVTEGNLIPNFERAWEEIAYFQIGDNPGRCEPTTGEINYANIFARLQQRGFAGVLGMEHGNAQKDKAGEQAVIDAYRACDVRT